MQSQVPGMLSADYVSSHDCCGQVRRKDCIDLKKTFGRRYVLNYEDPAFAGSRCPWHRQILCKVGKAFIAPSGGTNLYAYAHGAKAKELYDLAEALPDQFKVAQGSNTEVGITFDVEHFAPVAVILQPKRR